MFKSFIRSRLEAGVRQYFTKHPEVKLIVVAGSVGKTTTKHAIAMLLSQKYRVGMDERNYNMELSAPLGILGIDYPKRVRSPLSWIRVFLAMRQRIKSPTGVDVIVQEIGADTVGDIAGFAKYLHPDIGVVTAVTPEHMAQFGTIDAVAAEELGAGNMAKLAVINRDDIDGWFSNLLTNTNLTTYGSTAAAEYHFDIQDYTIADGFTGTLCGPGLPEGFVVTVRVVGEHSLRPVMGAVAVAVQCGLSPDEIRKGVEQLHPLPGRMNVLEGLDNTVIIDDTYNSSPAAAEAAVRELYTCEAPQRIAVLGSMNELGASSQLEHDALGMMCDPALLAWVVTIGEEAEKYLAPAARKRGCQVKCFRSAIDAGAFVRSVLEPSAVVLVKGSQGGIYAEEAVKVLCHMGDESELVRQSEEWMAVKNMHFSKF